MMTCRIRYARYQKLVSRLDALGFVEAAKWLRANSWWTTQKRGMMPDGQSNIGFVGLPVPMNPQLMGFLRGN